MTSAPAPTAAPELRREVPISEPRRGRRGRHLHRARLYTWAALTVALLAVVIVLVSSNSHAVTLDWAFGSTRTSLVWVVTAATVCGWLLGIATAATIHRRTRRPR